MCPLPVSLEYEFTAADSPRAENGTGAGGLALSWRPAPQGQLGIAVLAQNPPLRPAALGQPGNSSRDRPEAGLLRLRARFTIPLSYLLENSLVQ